MENNGTVTISISDYMELIESKKVLDSGTKFIRIRNWAGTSEYFTNDEDVLSQLQSVKDEVQKLQCAKNYLQSEKEGLESKLNELKASTVWQFRIWRKYS